MPDTKKPAPAPRRTGAAEQAPLGRRVVALVIDWLLAMAISAGFFGYDSVATLVIFAVMTFVLVGTLGMTIGHRFLSIGVRTLAGRPPGFLRALVRTLSLCLLVPAVVTDHEGRSLHDRWAKTRIVRI